MEMTPQHIPPLTQIRFACFLVVSRGLWKAVWWVVLGVHVDVHGEWVVCGWLQCTICLSMTDVVCLGLYAETVESMHEQCWVCMVCMVCVVYGLYGRLEFNMKFYCC